MIICIIIAIILIIAGVGFTIWSFCDGGLEDGFPVFLSSAFIVGLIDFFLVSPFVALDKGSGTTIGTITAVDKNFFGTTKLYIKTSENNEDTYCIEDDSIVNVAKDLIGKKVQLFYGERVGLYHLNQCRQAPIEEIREIGEDK